MTTTAKSLRSTIATLAMGAVLATSVQVSVASADSGVTSTERANALNIVALRDSYLTQNPGKQSLNIMRHKNRGFKFYADGRVLYVAQGKRLVKTMTRITSATSDEVCIAPEGMFAGACLTLTKSGGKMEMFYRFGNGPSGKWDARFLQ